MSYYNIPVDGQDEQQMTTTKRERVELFGSGRPSSPGELRWSEPSVDEMLTQYEQIESGDDETKTDNQARPST